MWKHKAPGEHVWWKMELQWEQKRGPNVCVDISLLHPTWVVCVATHCICPFDWFIKWNNNKQNKY